MSSAKFSFAKFRPPIIISMIFYVIAVALWQFTRHVFYLYNFLYIGTALGIGLATYTALPHKKKPWGRRIAQFLVGTYMLVFLGLIQRENMQIEGFFFYLLSGFFYGSVIHYLVAKIVGPVVFNRGWCGWACWTAMVLDLLPYRRNVGRKVHKKWGLLRYAHFTLSFMVVLALWFVLKTRVHYQSVFELYWLLGGNALYYVLGIVLAFWLKDNRAFCKYVCPIPVLQKVTSGIALLKIEGDAEKCTNCGACSKACPMDIPITDYILQNRRVSSTECVLCFECVNVCTREALFGSFTWSQVGHEKRLTNR